MSPTTHTSPLAIDVAAASLPLALRVPVDRPVNWLRLLSTNPSYLASQISANYIEIVRTAIPGVWLIVDEEGLYRDSPLTNRHVAGILYPGRIVGDALVVGSVETMDGPDIGGLTQEQLQELAFRGIKAEDLP